MKQNTLPFNLQFFAEGTGDAGSGAGTNTSAGTGAGSAAGAMQQAGQQIPPFEFDYEKLASIVTGKQNVTEDTVLKNYFKQQGLSQNEAAQAMQQFKEQKAKSTPDVSAMQTQLTQAQTLAQRAEVEKAAVLEAVELGLNVKTIPYVLKMADLSNVTGQDGKLNTENLKNAINKVLEDVPQLKPAQESQRGFQIGGSGGEQQTAQSDQLASIFGNKK